MPPRPFIDGSDARPIGFIRPIRTHRRAASRSLSAGSDRRLRAARQPLPQRVVPFPDPLEGERETQEQLSLADHEETPFDVTEILLVPKLDETVLPDGTETVQDGTV